MLLFKKRPLQRNLWVDCCGVEGFGLFPQCFREFRGVRNMRVGFPTRQRCTNCMNTHTQMGSASPSAVALASALRPAVRGLMRGQRREGRNPSVEPELRFGRYKVVSFYPLILLKSLFFQAE